MKYLLAFILLLISTKAYSEDFCANTSLLEVSFTEPPIPANQADDDTLLWLSRAFVSEAGFGATTDYATFAWILARKWHERVVKNPSWTFKQEIFAYCTGFKHKTINRPRQRWVQHLPEDGITKPLGWTYKANWGVHKKHWSAVRIFAKAWSLGQIEDPCKGKATDWAAPHVKVNKHDFIKVPCGKTKNRYYKAR